LLTILALAAAVLQPTGKWVLNADAAECGLAHEYGPEAARVMFGLRRLTFEERPNPQLILVQPKRDGAAAAAGQAKLVLLPDGLEVDASVRSVDLPDGRELLQLVPSGGKAIDFGGTEQLRIASEGREPLTLMLQRPAAALKALEGCKAAAEKSVYDQAGMPVPVSVPKYDMTDWITFGDYPAEAIRRNEQGVTGVRWRVGTGGRVDECLVVQGSGSPTLDAKTCALIRGKHIGQARAADGKVTVFYAAARFSWALRWSALLETAGLRV